MLIGIIGEDPYDTDSIKNILSNNYDKEIFFKPILREVRGSHLLSKKTKKLFDIEIQKKKYDLIIFSVDLDDLEHNTKKLENIKKEVKNILVNINDYILLIHIFELECLILADIESFNKIFNSTINFRTNPMFKERPKEFLQEKTSKLRKKFAVDNNPDIFEKLDFNALKKNCKYFKTFISELDDKIIRLKNNN